MVSTDPRQPAAARDRFDVVIDTVAVAHDVDLYLRLVALDGTLSQAGHLGPITVEAMDLLVGRKKLTSAGSGGTATAAMLEFCAHNDVRYRFVVDLAGLDRRGQAVGSGPRTVSSSSPS